MAPASALATPPNAALVSNQAKVTPSAKTDDCQHLSGCNINCDAKGVGSPLAGPMITPAYEKARAFLGTSPTDINSKFGAIQEMNFAQGNAKLIISRLSDKELAGIAYYYNRTATAGQTDLLRILASKLDAGSLVRVAKAFGSIATQRAVDNYSSSETKGAFARKMKMTLGIPRYAATAAVASAPMASMSTDTQSLQQGEEAIDEVYLDYRTAPVGNTSVEAGLVEAGLYDGLGATSLGWWIGYDIGGPVANWLINKYDPQLEVTIGGTVDSLIQDINDADTEFQQGNYESSWDDLFGEPLSNLGDYSGDWDIGNSYEFYEQTGGGSC